ncbi:hypothetical protein EBI_26171 [Enterocytozoon bieneusi H348]|nr:hypothetical protein EBI_26171 [Enterocytozoon bieneusi H348]|eukprot:XP_002650127.1 hypothetical protein EBI_26171 [Enterocytozoon bieneusi H348]
MISSQLEIIININAGNIIALMYLFDHVNFLKYHIIFLIV